MLNLKENFKLLFSIIKTKQFIISISLILIGVLITVFSPSANYNFWNRLTDCLTNETNIMILLLVVSSNVISISKELKNSNILLRYSNYETYLKNSLIINLIYTLLLLIINLIFCVLGTFIINLYMDSGNVTFIIHEIYGFNQLFYLIFFEFRMIIFILLIVTIIFFIYQNNNSKTTLFILVLIVSTFFININYPSLVNDLTNIPLIVTRFFSLINYANIYLELSATLIQFILLCIINSFLKYLLIKKRNELV